MLIQRGDLLGARAALVFVDDRLRTCGLSDLSDSLQLIASEVVTNALIHAGSDVDVRLRAFDDHVRLEVRDSRSNPPVPSPLALSEEDNADAEHGRGLLIVDALGGAWNSFPNGRGKNVVVHMPLHDLARTTRAPDQQSPYCVSAGTAPGSEVRLWPRPLRVPALPGGQGS
ncbi:ATP-binding protein [Streptomyces sp. NPDC006658]|uniref:ATP-binding protein n=1 Tax=Streptomyces sp. NPDC006658 TaxID=3156900 RepID=UPI0033C76DB4